MGLSDVLARAAVRRAHVLLVEVPGWWATRVAVERAVAARGWRPALSPADADVLLVCGRSGERLTAAVERVWDQVPGPRTRGAVLDPGHADAALGAAAADLLDGRRQREDAATREPAVGKDGDGAAGDMDHGDMDHGDMDHAGMDHAGMDHADMEMSPHGIPLASGDEDRDGLEMDVLNVPLGPVLPLWPAGLVLRCTLAGDVVTAAHAEVLPAAGQVAPQPEPYGAVAAARRVDAAATVLALAGWDDAAASARQVRDGLLDGGETTGAARSLLRLRRRVARSRTLRWSLRGLGRRAGHDRDDDGAVEPAGGVLDRLLGLLDAATADLGAAGSAGDRPRPPAAAEALAALPSLVSGLDVAAARLVVASLALDTARVAPRAEAAGG